MVRMRWVSMLLLGSMAAGGAAAQIEHLGQPCRGKNVLAGRLIDTPEGERLVLSNTSEASNMELLFVDFENDTGKAVKAPAGQGAWVLEPVAANRMVVGTYYDGKFMTFDLDRMEFVKTVQTPGEEYVFTGKPGGDGGFYGGTYPGAKLARLDLGTYEVKTWAPETTGNKYLRYVNQLPDGKLLCSYGMGAPESRVFDPAAGAFGPPVDGMKELKPGALWNGFLLYADASYDGRTLERLERPPFPLPGEGEWSVLTNLTTSETVYLQKDRELFRYRVGDKEPSLVARLDPRLMTGLRGISRNGKLVGSTGQDYYVVTAATGETVRRPIPVESSGRPPHFIDVAPDGRLWGGPMFGQTLFWMNPETSETVNTGVVSNRGGEVYDVVFLDGKIYAVAYVGGEVIEYDPAQPWDQWNNKNPRVIASVGGAYIRPNAGVKVGPDRKLYSGWMAKYGVYGGAVAITDPATGKTELIENPVGEQAISAIAVSESEIFIGTSLSANGLGSNPEGKAKFAVLDRENRMPVFIHEFEDRGAVGTVAEMDYDPGTSTTVFSAGGKLWFFDAKERRLRDVPGAALPKVTGNLALPGDGRAYYVSDSSVVAVDIRTGAVASRTDTKARAEHLAVDVRGAAPVLYVSSGPDIYRIKLDSPAAQGN